MIVEEVGKGQQMSEPDTMTFLVGHKDGHVFLQGLGGRPFWIKWTPPQAREIAALLLAAAEEADR